MNKTEITVSIVIPAYNEEINFRKGRLSELLTFLKKQKFTWEILFVNDGSTDDTLSLLNIFSKDNTGVSVIDIPHGGKVAAVESGVMEAKGTYVLFTDFDQSTPISALTQVLKKFHDGADIVIARRKHIKGWPMHKILRSRIYNLLVQLIILPGIKDTQCGFKAFKTDLAQKLFKQLIVTRKNQQGRYMGAFDVELLFLAKKYGYTIESIDVDWYYIQSGKLAFSEPFKMLLNIITIRYNDFLNKYNRRIAV